MPIPPTLLEEKQDSLGNSVLRRNLQATSLLIDRSCKPFEIEARPADLTSANYPPGEGSPFFLVAKRYGERPFRYPTLLRRRPKLVAGVGVEPNRLRGMNPVCSRCTVPQSGNALWTFYTLYSAASSSSAVYFQNAARGLIPYLESPRRLNQIHLYYTAW